MEVPAATARNAAAVPTAAAGARQRLFRRPPQGRGSVCSDGRRRGAAAVVPMAAARGAAAVVPIAAARNAAAVVPMTATRNAAAVLVVST